MRFNNYIILPSVLVIFFSLSNMSHNEAKNINKKERITLIKFTDEKKGIKEYQLDNSIKILLKQNNSIPLVTFSIWYKVGSRNESSDTRGLAHFLEHMMFKGTKKFKKGEISEIIQNLGGVFNAFTSNDCTAYYATIPPKYLEKIMEIEADRFNGSLLDENELNSERTVVLSELEGDLNNPVTFLDHALRNKAYEVSPYKHPTIGYKEDIKTINKNIMKNFYKTYYNPKNATIVLVGDFNENYVLNLIEKYFGSIKNDSNHVNPDDTPRDKIQNNEKRLSVKRAGTFKLLEIAYHIVSAKHEDIYPLNIIEEILIKGKNSPLKEKLIETGLATDIYGGAEVHADPGLFYMLVSLTPKASHKKVEKIIFNELDKLIKNPPGEKEILAAKNRIKASYLFQLDGTLHQTLNIGYFNIISDWKQSTKWVDNISKVTQEDISDALKKYFTKENRTIGCFIPKMRKGTKYEATPLILSKTQHYIKQNSDFPQAVNTTFSHLSNLSPNKFKFNKQSLKDGSTLLIYKNIDLPITLISGVIKGGSSLLPKKYEWDSEIIAQTLEKGSKNYTKEEIEDILDSTGSEIEFSCDEESFKFMIASLNDNLSKTLNLFTDILNYPTFPEEEVKKEKEKLIAETIESKDSTHEIVGRRFSQVLYPKDHPYFNFDFNEDIKLIKKINAERLHKNHKILIKENKITFSIITNQDENKLHEAIKIIEENLFNGKTKQDIEINIPDTLLRDTPKKENIYVKDKLQSDVYLGHAGNLKRTDHDFYKIHVANFILGGSSLTSRLAKKVRDESGLVYTIYSYINASHGKGEFGIYFGSNNDNVDKAISLIQEEVKKFATEGITEGELNKAKAALIDSFVSRNLSTYKNIGNTFIGIEFYNLGDNYINEYPKIIGSLKLSDINKAIKKYIFPDKLNIVIAGEYSRD